MSNYRPSLTLFSYPPLSILIIPSILLLHYSSHSSYSSTSHFSLFILFSSILVTITPSPFSLRLPIPLSSFPHSSSSLLYPILLTPQSLTFIFLSSSLPLLLPSLSCPVLFSPYYYHYSLLPTPPFFISLFLLLSINASPPDAVPNYISFFLMFVSAHMGTFREGSSKVTK